MKWSTILCVGLSGLGYLATPTYSATCVGFGSCNHVDVTVGDSAFDTAIIVADGAGGASTVAGIDPCVGCRWWLTPACSANGAVSEPGPAPGHDDVCPGAANTCEALEVLFRIYVQRPPDPRFTQVATICIGPNNPVITRGQLIASAQRLLDRLPVTASTPKWQPSGGAVTGIPAVFHATGDSVVTDVTTLGGIVVRVTARPTRWTWHVAPGVDIESDRAGGAYPDHAAEHLYRRKGTYPITVTTTWTGYATIAGLTEDEIVGTVDVTSAPRVLTVREARAELIAG